MPNKQYIRKELRTAYHEAAHFVVHILEHDQNIPSVSTPDCLSIKKDTNSRGRLTDPAFSLYSYNPSIVPLPNLIKHTVCLLSGVAAESIVTNEPILEVDLHFGSQHEGHDINLTCRLLGHLMNRPSVDLEVRAALNGLLVHTKGFLETPPVWAAIEFVANRLVVAKEISRTNGLFDLIDEVHDLPGLNQIRVPIPDKNNLLN